MEDVSGITLQQAAAELDQIVAEKGADYVYPGSRRDPGAGCANFEDGSPSCIIGHWYAFHGMEDKEVMAADCKYASVGMVNSLMGLHMDPLVVKFFASIQVAQDMGTPWGEAVAYGKDRFNV